MKTQKHVKAILLVLILTTIFCSCSKNTSNTSKTETQYPEKQITMIVPYGAGGTTDLVGRQFAIELEKHLGQKITIINQGGASGSIGAKTVLDAQADGYTILFTADSLGTQRVMGLSEMSYNDFTPIMVVANDPKVIVVNKNSKYNTLKDLIEDMINRPGKVKMSYTGPGGSGHVQGLIYNKLGLDMAMTAYSGGSDCILAVLGDQVDFTNSNFSTVVNYVASGDLKLLGISSSERLSKYPEVPTIVEVLPDSIQYLNNPFTPLSLVVSNKVPKEVVTVLREAAEKAVKEQSWIDYVKDNCIEKLYEKYPSEKDAVEFYNNWESLVSWLLFDAGAAKFSPENFNIPRK